MVCHCFQSYIFCVTILYRECIDRVCPQYYCPYYNSEINWCQKEFYMITPSPFKRSLFFILSDIILSLGTLFLAYNLRFNFHIEKQYLDNLLCDKAKMRLPNNKNLNRTFKSLFPFIIPFHFLKTLWKLFHPLCHLSISVEIRWRNLGKRSIRTSKLNNLHHHLSKKKLVGNKFLLFSDNLEYPPLSVVHLTTVSLKMDSKISPTSWSQMTKIMSSWDSMLTNRNKRLNKFFKTCMWHIKLKKMIFS